MRLRERLTPYMLLGVLTLGTGLGIGLGLSEAPARSSSASQTTTTVAALPSILPSTQPVSLYLESFAFLNPNRGYGVFPKRGPGIDACDYLVGRTDDGGNHFSRLVPVTSGSCTKSGPMVSSLVFDNHGDGFFFGPALFVTHNGGRSWKRDHQPGSVLSVQTIGDSVWMLEADCPKTGPTSICPLSLLESNDGGVSWYPTLSQPPASAERGNGSEANWWPSQSWLVRPGQSSAYVVSMPPSDHGRSDNSFTYSSTSDGGATWDQGQIPCGILAWSISLSAAPDGTLMAVCTGGPGGGSQAKAVSRSEDGGVSWVVYPGCNVQAQYCANFTPTVLDSGYIGAATLSAVSSTTAFLGGTSSLLVTHDGGANWGPVGSNVGDGESGPNEVTFFNPSDGLVLGNDTLYVTNDGGVNWAAMKPSVVRWGATGRLPEFRRQNPGD